MSLVALVGCAGTGRTSEPESPLRRVERFYAAPVIYDFIEPADWELPPGEWDEKTADFSEAFVHRLEVTKRAPISRLEGDVPAGGASIQLFVTEVDLGFYGGIVRKAAICKGELVIIDSIGVELARYDVEFRTPGDAGWQWYTYGGRLESAHDAYAVDVISLIQRERE
jgi:hypothetical protein